jgi:hypothetical protein
MLGEAHTPCVLLEGQPVYLPILTIEQFCEKYRLNQAIRDTLHREGYETAGALVGESDDTLAKLGLKIGYLAELKRALREFLATERLESKP